MYLDLNTLYWLDPLDGLRLLEDREIHCVLTENAAKWAELLEIHRVVRSYQGRTVGIAIPDAAGMLRNLCPRAVCPRCGCVWQHEEYQLSVRQRQRIYRDQAACQCGQEHVSGIVLDPYCKDSKVILAAEKLGLRWLGFCDSQQRTDALMREVMDLRHPQEMI